MEKYMNYCSYYQATIRREDCWFLTSIIRSYEHVAFDRTVDVERSIFEFFVPEAMEAEFLQIMHYFQEQGIAVDVVKLPNRLMDESEIV